MLCCFGKCKRNNSVKRVNKFNNNDSPTPVRPVPRSLDMRLQKNEIENNLKLNSKEEQEAKIRLKNKTKNKRCKIRYSRNSSNH